MPKLIRDPMQLDSTPISEFNYHLFCEISPPANAVSEQMLLVKDSDPRIHLQKTVANIQFKSATAAISIVVSIPSKTCN
ncbi:hypothetical protein CEXT_335151 [Caerostris extrusa]|uniref:Uncharacterized protein n=1 Tax=Caerostris extrusa TaxID=172846 RepID=A0AAV4NRC9_CAEEX|nr:hypothetical protein CEXT_335151 [Caerostris extrusa]